MYYKAYFPCPPLTRKYVFIDNHRLAAMKMVGKGAADLKMRSGQDLGTTFVPI